MDTLSAFWDFFAEKEAETIWNYKHKFDELDLNKGKDGNELDELNAHRFLEAFKQEMTVREMRDLLRKKNALREKGMIGPCCKHLHSSVLAGASKYVPLCHFLAAK